jgi:hypothetical protein
VCDPTDPLIEGPPYGATIWMKKPERQSEMNLAHGIDIIAVV